MGVFIFLYFVIICRLVICEHKIPALWLIGYKHIDEKNENLTPMPLESRLLDDNSDDSDTYHVVFPR